MLQANAYFAGLKGCVLFAYLVCWVAKRVLNKLMPINKSNQLICILARLASQLSEHVARYK